MMPLIVAWMQRHGVPAFLAPNYFVLAGAGSLAGCAIVLALARREGGAVHLEARALAVAYLAALAGGTVFEVVRAIPAAIAAGSVAPLFAVGRAAYGAVLGGVLGATLYLRAKGQPVGPFLDRVAVGGGAVFAFVRTGCFVAGCDYGQPTAGPFGVRFPAESLAAFDHAHRGWVPLGAQSLPVHPTQLYEAALGAAASVVAYALGHARPGATRDGRVFAGWIAAYAAGRFAIETLRGDADRGVYLGALSSAQLVSIAVVATSALWLARNVRATPRALATAAATALAAALLAAPATSHAQAAQGAAAQQAPQGYAPAPQYAPQQPVPYGQPAPYGQPYPQYGQPYPQYGQPYPQYGYPPPQYVDPRATVPVGMSQGPAGPMPYEYARLNMVGLRMSIDAPVLHFGRADIADGFAFAGAGALRLRAGGALRIELGVEARYFRSTIATHVSVGPLARLVAETSGAFEFIVGVSPTTTWVLFDSPFYSSTNAFGVRVELGFQWALARNGALGFSPLAFSMMNSASVGTIYAWEPRLWFELSFGARGEPARPAAQGAQPAGNPQPAQGAQGMQPAQGAQGMQPAQPAQGAQPAAR